MANVAVPHNQGAVRFDHLERMRTIALDGHCDVGVVSEISPCPAQRGTGRTLINKKKATERVAFYKDLGRGDRVIK